MLTASARSISVNQQEFKDALLKLLREQPGLHAEPVQLFYREGAPYELGRVFDYLFVGQNASADGAEDKIVRFRSRKPDKRLLAIEAFNVENLSGAGHSVTSYQFQFYSLGAGRRLP
jgi:hypothetical protein